MFSRRRDVRLPVGASPPSEFEHVHRKRILVLGSRGHGHGVTSYEWDKTPSGLNVADYDVVVLNFAAFENDGPLAAGFPPERLPQSESLVRLLFSPNAEVIVIGNPATLIGPPPEGLGLPYDNRYRADYWLPMEIGIESDTGTQFSVDAEEWEGYFEALSGWSWIVSGELWDKYNDVSQYLRPVTTGRIDGIVRSLEPLARTRYEKFIAFRVHLTAVLFESYIEGYGGLAEPDPKSAVVVGSASPVYWLPAPDRVSVEEAIDEILRDRYGIAQESRIAEWAIDYSLPAERPIAEEIAELERQRQSVEGRLSEARARALAAARPRLLLYEKGKDALEPVVRETLAKLGADVFEPASEGVEDGRLSWGQHHAVLEIKGRAGPIKQDDVRQVVQWASDARLERGHDFKPVIVGNPHCDNPPGDRDDPFAPNALRYAINGGVVLLTTTQLFEALHQKQSGVFDEQQFWEVLFTGSGPVQLDEPRPDQDAASTPPN